MKRADNGKDFLDQDSIKIIEGYKAKMALLSRTGNFTTRGERFFAEIIWHLEFLERANKKQVEHNKMLHEVIRAEFAPPHSEGCQNRRFGHLKVCRP